METPTLKDVMEAREVVYRHLKRTPLILYPGINELVGTEVWLKHENHLPLGAFKLRGGINLMSRLDQETQRTGVVTASTGNHGQSIAYAGKRFGIRTVVVLPNDSNPAKVASLRRLGAELVFHGQVFDEARLHCANLSKEYGYRYIHSANEPLLIAGVATYTLEILEELPQIEYLFVPIGGGSGASGACIVAKAINPDIRVIGVQSQEAPAAYYSWKTGRHTKRQVTTFAEGLATGVGYDLTQHILRQYLDDFLLVSDQEIKQAIIHLIERAHTLSEGAGAAALAGVIKMRSEIKGKVVAAVVSGGNISVIQLKEVLSSSV